MTPKILGLVPDKTKETKSMDILIVDVAFPGEDSLYIYTYIHIFKYIHIN